MGIALRVQTPDHVSCVFDDFMLSRIASMRGATRSELLRDIGALSSHRLSPSELRQRLEAGIARVTAAGFAQERRGRLALTSMGKERICGFLGCVTLPGDWQAIRDMHLVAYALGLAGESAQRIKSLTRPEGLRAAILQQAYGLPGKRPPSAAKIRCALAVIALERAFGNKLKGGLDAGKGLSAKAGRLLAGQLSQRPREFGTDARLIAALAAEACGAPQASAAALRTAILKNAITRALHKPLGPQPVQQPPVQQSLALVEAPPSPVQAPIQNIPPIASVAHPAVANRPNLPDFARIVRGIAEHSGQGWPGNKKIFICVVWHEIQTAYKEWGVSEIEFKAMLVEAHRTGHLVLVNADLRSKSDATELQASAVTYKNTVWHYVRAEI
ncbi:MAG: hypothetical protein AAFW82_01430 [Pseudomonadota bacterium]